MPTFSYNIPRQSLRHSVFRQQKNIFPQSPSSSTVIPLRCENVQISMNSTILVPCPRKNCILSSRSEKKHAELISPDNIRYSQIYQFNTLKSPVSAFQSTIRGLFYALSLCAIFIFYDINMLYQYFSRFSLGKKLQAKVSLQQ